MKRSVIETVLGAVVLFIAAFFLAFSYKTADMSSSKGYQLVADFSGIGGLKAGDDVEISGVKVGAVAKVDLNPQTYLAHVTMTVNDGIKIPDDSAAIISSESLLGGRFLALQPGASDNMLKAGGRVPYTQAPQNLEQLLGQFIFGMKSDKKDVTASSNGAQPDAAAATPSLTESDKPAAKPAKPAAKPAAESSSSAPAENSTPAPEGDSSQTPAPASDASHP